MNAEELFEILCRENSQMLIAYIRSAVRDDGAADDVFQETMLTAWRRLDDYDKRRPFGPWLRGIAARVMMAHFRKSAKRAELCEEATLEYLSARFEQLRLLRGDSFDERLDALRECVERLPEAYREPIRLRYREELPLSAIADRLGMAAEAVKKRLQRAKTRLLECVERKLQAIESPS